MLLVGGAAKARFAKTEKDKLEPQIIRANVDLRIPNKSMERMRIVQTPVVQDFIHRFHDCQVFANLTCDWAITSHPWTPNPGRWQRSVHHGGV